MNKLSAKEALDLPICKISELYLEEKTQRRRANTVYGYESSIKLHVLPRFGDRPIGEIDRDDVQAWVDELAPTHGAGGAEKAYKCLRQMINWAIRKWALYVPNPTIGIEMPRKQRNETAALTQRRLKKLIRGMVGCEFEPTVILSASLGLRPGESYALSWESINWRTGVVKIRATLQQIASDIFEYPPKTAKSEREAFLPPWALERLHTIWIERERPKGRIIGSAKPDKVCRTVQNWIARFRLPKVTMKNLRHTWATIAAQSGVSIETVAAMLGHSNINTCYRYYIALTKAVMKRAQRKVARTILGKCDDMYKGIVIPMPPSLAAAA